MPHSRSSRALSTRAPLAPALRASRGNFAAGPCLGRAFTSPLNRAAEPSGQEALAPGGGNAPPSTRPGPSRRLATEEVPKGRNNQKTQNVPLYLGSATFSILATFKVHGTREIHSLISRLFGCARACAAVSVHTCEQAWRVVTNSHSYPPHGQYVHL